MSMTTPNNFLIQVLKVRCDRLSILQNTAS